MGYNRAGARAKQKERRRKKEERRLVAKASPAEPEGGVVAKVKRAAVTAAAVAKGVVEGVKEGLTSKRPAKKNEGE